MAAVRLGVKKLEDSLEEERFAHSSLQAELKREKQELENVKSQLESSQTSQTETSIRLNQASKELAEVKLELDDERARSLSLARDLRGSLSKSLVADKSTIS